MLHNDCFLSQVWAATCVGYPSGLLLPKLNVFSPCPWCILPPSFLKIASVVFCNPADKQTVEPSSHIVAHMKRLITSMKKVFSARGKLWLKQQQRCGHRCVLNRSSYSIPHIYRYVLTLTHTHSHTCAMYNTFTHGNMIVLFYLRCHFVCFTFLYKWASCGANVAQYVHPVSIFKWTQKKCVIFLSEGSCFALNHIRLSQLSDITHSAVFKVCQILNPHCPLWAPNRNNRHTVWTTAAANLLLSVCKDTVLFLEIPPNLKINKIRGVVLIPDDVLILVFNS